LCDALFHLLLLELLLEAVRVVPYHHLPHIQLLIRALSRLLGGEDVRLGRHHLGAPLGAVLPGRAKVFARDIQGQGLPSASEGRGRQVFSLALVNSRARWQLFGGDLWESGLLGELVALEHILHGGFHLLL
jgi:hypothetical protein